MNNLSVFSRTHHWNWLSMQSTPVGVNTHPICSWGEVGDLLPLPYFIQLLDQVFHTSDLQVFPTSGNYWASWKADCPCIPSELYMPNRNEFRWELTERLAIKWDLFISWDWDVWGDLRQSLFKMSRCDRSESSPYVSWWRALMTENE